MKTKINSPSPVHGSGQTITVQGTRWTPKVISNLDLAFPGSVGDLMPKWEDIPREFCISRTKWNRFFSDMFYCGIASHDLKPKEGIDATAALRHIRCIAGSFEPKHEHKEAAVAYLMSLWFEDSSTWKAK